MGGGTPIIMSALVSLRVKERHKETRDKRRTQDTELDNKSFEQIRKCKLCLVEHFSYSQNDLLYLAPKYTNQEQNTMLQSQFRQ